MAGMNAQKRRYNEDMEWRSQEENTPMVHDILCVNHNNGW
ncbi:hypothetical protein VCR17J2_90183 [Vibrio coralliirubri]|nr:hypothetical protein VCR17J2_90183 [Vibrio coralliirubri]